MRLFFATSLINSYITAIMKLQVKKLPSVERDISWMYFNKRVLDEAANANNPLLERLNFLGIYSRNLDEYFRVRVATLRRLVEIETTSRVYKSSSKSILKAILKLNETYTKEFEKIFADLKASLESENIIIINEQQITETQSQYINSYYKDVLMNSLFPILVSKMSHEPELNDESIYLAVKISFSENPTKKKKKEFALIEVPTEEFSRFVVLPIEDDKTYIMFLDDVIRACLPQIFSHLNYDKYEAYTVKFTRDAEMEFENVAYLGLLDKVSKGVKSRKKGDAIRFVFDREIPNDLLKLIERLLNIEKYDAYVKGGRYHNLKDLMSFPKLARPELKYPPAPPVPVCAFDDAVSVLSLVRTKDQYLHYPYHSFNNFIRLIREAAISPDVKEIKICIYRLAKNSKIVKALICAALNGKKVTAMVELLARFDESSNISWAKRMQAAGIKVIFGVEGLKVHSKIAHISAKNGNIACIGTGNFHEGTATVYTDFTLMTANKKIVDEIEQVFNFLEHPYLNPRFSELIVSPMSVRKKLYELIRTETENAKKGKPAYIYVKINHIVDEGIIEKLYLAAKAGVEIKLLVRGNCSIVTGIPKVSENIEVCGIIDRYLEHARIMIFANGGNERYFIGSADWMQRNLDGRIEVYTPVYDPDFQSQLKRVIEFGLKDNTKARVVDGSGHNLIKQTEDQTPFGSQTQLYQYYKNQYEQQREMTSKRVDE